MLEKRKFVRLRAPIGVVYQLTKKQRRQKPQSSFIENISAGGLSLTVKENLRDGDLLEIDIQIPHLKEPVHAVCEVVWVSSCGEGADQTRQAGIRFRDVEAEDLNHVLEYIHAIGIG